MADDLLEGMDDMFGDSAAVTQPEPQVPAPVQPTEPVQTPPAPEIPAQPRAADGTFAPKEPVAPPAPAPVQPVEKPRVDPEQFKGYLDERDKRKALEAKVKELESRQAPPAQIPSVQTDPAAWEAYQQQLVQQTRTNTIFDVSETMAREKHGDDAVATAMDWAMNRAQSSPAFAAEYLKQKHPIDWAVKQQKRDTTMSAIGDDPDAWAIRRAAELAAAPQTQAAQPSQAASPQPLSAPAPQVPQPPRSIASATAAGGGVNVVPPAGEFAMADEIFNR